MSIDRNHVAIDVPLVHWWTPGRVEVFGKHTDYAGGRSLVCAVPRGITASAWRTTDGTVTVQTLGERATYSSAGEGPVTDWRCYPRTVIRRLAANFPAAHFSADIRVSSDLPQAAGISSSTAFLIAIAECLIDSAGIKETKGWREAIRTPEDRAGYFGCIENGATFGPLEGDEGFGTHGGSEDHAAIVMSRAGEMRRFSYAPIRLESVVPMPPGWTFVIASTGVMARKAGAVQNDYNRLALATAALVAAWREAYPDDDRSLGRLAREGALKGWQPPRDLRWRLEHFMAEDSRVADASLAFASGDITAIGELAQASQAEADRLLGNQIDETRTLVSLAREIGAPAASAFGAGWGGSAWALVTEDDAQPFLDEWLSAFGQRYGGHQQQGFVAPPSPGAHRLQPEHPHPTEPRIPSP